MLWVKIRFYFPQGKNKKLICLILLKLLVYYRSKIEWRTLFIQLFQEYFAAVYLANYYVQGNSSEIKRDIAKKQINFTLCTCVLR